MKKVLICENEANILNLLGIQLTNHDIVGEAQTLGEAFSQLRRIVMREVRVDVILLDGNLRSEAIDPIFELPNQQFSSVHSKSNVIKGSDYTQPGGHAKAIMEVIRKTNISAAVVGISAYPMSEYGIEVDYDLTKLGIPELDELLEQLG